MMRVALALVALALCARAEYGQVLQLHGSGTTNPSKLFWKIQVSEECGGQKVCAVGASCLGVCAPLCDHVGEWGRRMIDGWRCCTVRISLVMCWFMNSIICFEGPPSPLCT